MKRFAVWLLLFAMVLGLCACAPTDQTPTEPEDPAAGLNVYIPEKGTQVRSILFIGNSNCSYFTDELVAVAKAAGIDLVVANLYVSGCSVKQHVERLEYDQAYTKYTVRENGKVTVYNDEISLTEALDERQWDAISLQQHYDPLIAANIAIAQHETNKYAKQIYDFVKTKQPDALLFWQQMWAFQLGYPTEEVVEEKRIETVEKQQAIHEVIQLNAKQICHENQAYRVPVGDAWQQARADERIGHTLSNKDTAGNTDYIHDGEVGGGQYLNACIWLEVLTQKSCIGNTFRPSYPLSEEKVVLLQQIAHQAVAALYGENYAQ